jgi:hypothetical protein
LLTFILTCLPPDTNIIKRPGKDYRLDHLAGLRPIQLHSSRLYRKLQVLFSANISLRFGSRKSCNLGSIIDDEKDENVEDIQDVVGANLDAIVDEGRSIF